MSSLHGKATPYLMWKSLTELFQSKSDQRKLALKDKLINIKCKKGDSMPKYLMRFTKCRDELGSVGVTVEDENLVSLDLLGLLKSWHSYQDSVNGREKLPGWERLWSDLVQEEIRHVPGLKKNLIFVAMLEDNGYDVVFSKGKAFLRSKTTGDAQDRGSSKEPLSVACRWMRSNGRQGKRIGEPG